MTNNALKYIVGSIVLLLAFAFFATEFIIIVLLFIQPFLLSHHYHNFWWMLTLPIVFTLDVFIIKYASDVLIFFFKCLDHLFIQID